MSETFYALKVEGGGFPTQAFVSLDSARIRAEQLARHTRSRVFLLAVQEIAIPVLPPIEETVVTWAAPGG